jgi:hypothetical protein
MIAPFRVLWSWRAATGQSLPLPDRGGAGGTTENPVRLINSCTPIQERFTLVC